MIDRDISTELAQQLKRMTREQQERVLQFARKQCGLAGGRFPQSDQPLMTHDEAQKMIEDIREAEQYAPFPTGLPRRDLLGFAGMLSAEEAEKMRRDIEEACEQVPKDE